MTIIQWSTKANFFLGECNYGGAVLNASSRVRGRSLRLITSVDYSSLISTLIFVGARDERTILQHISRN